MGRLQGNIRQERFSLCQIGIGDRPQSAHSTQFAKFDGSDKEKHQWHSQCTSWNKSTKYNSDSDSGDVLSSKKALKLKRIICH